MGNDRSGSEGSICVCVRLQRVRAQRTSGSGHGKDKQVGACKDSMKGRPRTSHPRRDRRQHKAILENLPVGKPQSNGEVEKFTQRVVAQVRRMKDALERDTRMM